MQQCHGTSDYKLPLTANPFSEEAAILMQLLLMPMKVYFALPSL